MTKLLIAYNLLISAAVIVVVQDAKNREIPARVAALVPEPQGPPVPFPLTRLADSPFLNPQLSASRRAAAIDSATNESESGRPVEKHTTPFGVYFLKVAVHAGSDEAPVVFGPGTQVRIMRHQAGKVRVTRNGMDFLVEESQLTNDPETVAALARTSS